MNKIVKLLCIAIVSVGLSHNVMAAESIDTVVKKSPINNSSTVAVSVKNAKTGRILYEYNQNKLMNPASSLKVFTMKPSYDTLGKDFQFKTQLYKDGQNNLYIKLAGDPTFTTNALATLLKKNKESVKDIIIDASATDYLEWGIGWMWDDDTNPYLPKFSPFTINENKITVEIAPGVNGKQPQIRNRSSYPTVLVNMLTNGSQNDITFERQPWATGDITLVKGTVKAAQNFRLPIDSTERYFTSCLKDAMTSAHTKYSGTIKTAPVPKDAKLIGEYASNTLENIIADTLKNSNNLNTELIFKTAGGKSSNTQGTTSNGVKMFEKYYESLKAQKPVIVDGSGASRNNLICADWMSEALNKIYNQENYSEFELLLAKPIEGTLSDRLLNISQHLRAKTGSISGASSITGYITAKSGVTYSFAIIIQNYSQPTSEIKAFEDKIINAIYNY